MQNEINQDHEIRSFVLNRGHSPTPKLSLKASPPPDLPIHMPTAHGHVESHPLSVEIAHLPSFKNTQPKCLT